MRELSSGANGRMENKREQEKLVTRRVAAAEGEKRVLAYSRPTTKQCV